MKERAEIEFISMLADEETGPQVDHQARFIDLLDDLLFIPWRKA